VLKRFTLPPPMTPTTRHGGAASTRIFATDTANSTTCIFHSTESAHLGLLSWNDTRAARLPRGSRKSLRACSCCFARFSETVDVQVAPRAPLCAGHVTQHHRRLAIGKCSHRQRSSLVVEDLSSA